MYQCLSPFLIYSVTVLIKTALPPPPKNSAPPLIFEKFPGPPKKFVQKLLATPLKLGGADAILYDLFPTKWSEPKYKRARVNVRTIL